MLPLILLLTPPDIKADLAYLHQLAKRVLDDSRVTPDGHLAAETNKTGKTLRVPGATRDYYPAFWVRDAAMMLGADFVPKEEVKGWIEVVAKTQPDHELRFGPLTIPPGSIPDHITISGDACWFPGAYTEQGNGSYGFLPPADDAFYFIQMVREYARLDRSKAIMSPKTAEACENAYRSVDTDPATGLVLCRGEAGKTRVDWGFCDSIHKSGLALFPSLLRWQAARDLAFLLKGTPRSQAYDRDAKLIARSIAKTFTRAVAPSETMLLSATELGRKDDVWGTAYAVWLGLLPKDQTLALARGLLRNVNEGGILAEGQVRHLPQSGAFGGHWESASSDPESYQNGGYWATPTGWLVSAIRRVDLKKADQVFSDYCRHLRDHEKEGAPWEWINPRTHEHHNAGYAASCGLVYAALTTHR